MADDQLPRAVPVEPTTAHQVNIYEAKSQLSRMVEHVEAGGEFVIARNGRPVARLVPLGYSAAREWSWPGSGPGHDAGTVGAGGRVLAQCGHLTVTATAPLAEPATDTGLNSCPTGAATPV